MKNEERVVLVDENDTELGTTLKSQVHTKNTPLHRAFSIFLFNAEGQTLVTQRALSKTTWPGIWSNSCCGHPAPKESYEAAILRRVREELGLDVQNLEKVSDYSYRFEHERVVENEICPIYRGVVSEEIVPNQAEVADFRWMDWNDFLSVLEEDKTNIWSPWVKEEVKRFTA